MRGLPLLILALTSCAGHPPDPDSPCLFDRPVTLSAENATLREALEEITRQSGVRFALDPGLSYEGVTARRRFDIKSSRAEHVVREVVKSFGLKAPRVTHPYLVHISRS